MLNKNSPGLLKKGAAKQSRIKNIAWQLRWLVRTRADIGLRPNGLVRLWQGELCHMGEAVLAVEGACSMTRAGPPLE